MKILYFCIILTSFFTYSATFKLGVENIPAHLMRIICPEKKDICAAGLITNQTGMDQKGNRTVDILLQQNNLHIKYIFVPEHGLNGTLAERDVHDSIDKKTQILVVSLYRNGSGKMMSPEQLKEIDVLIFDMQDSGMRHYTYISTLLNCMKIAAEYYKPFVVLDRPNPLGSAMEGPLVESPFISFISIAPIPLRHGMTIGELAQYFNAHVLEKPLSLHVVKMTGYNRARGFAGNFLQQLSPNLKSLQSCYGYSFLGLLGEVEPFDVGVGTRMAFRCILLPEALKVSTDVWQRLQQLLLSYGVQSSLYQHVNKKTKKLNKGIRLHFSRISELHAFELFIAILQFFKQEGLPFSFSAAFNKAVGTARVQEVIAGTLSKTEFFDNITEDLKQFRTRARELFLYKPLPTVFPNTHTTNQKSFHERSQRL